MDEGGQKGVKITGGKSTGVKGRREAKEPRRQTVEGPSRGLRQEPGKPWGASMEPGVPSGRQGVCGPGVGGGGLSHHKQGPGTGLTRAEVRGQRT